MQIIPADSDNETEIKQILESCGLPTADLSAEKLVEFLILCDGEALAGVIGLERYGRVGLLRSLAVQPELRDQGRGGQLIQQIEKRAREQGVKELYLLTTTAEGFFARHGYLRVPRESAPTEIRSTAEFRELCPDSAVLMRKLLV